MASVVLTKVSMSLKARPGYVLDSVFYMTMQLDWQRGAEELWVVQIGVAGRTGCGKSTLMMALYRIVEPAGGRVVIDGIDVATIGLADLRSRLALVPQV